MLAVRWTLFSLTRALAFRNLLLWGKEVMTGNAVQNSSFGFVCLLSLLWAVLWSDLHGLCLLLYWSKGSLFTLLRLWCFLVFGFCLPRNKGAFVQLYFSKLLQAMELMCFSEASWPFSSLSFHSWRVWHCVAVSQCFANSFSTTIKILQNFSFFLL